MSVSTIKKQLVPAIIQSLLIIVVRFFTIPWEIWSGAASRLSESRTLSRETPVSHRAKSEFPVFEWFKSSWDAAIFLSWFIGIIVAVIGLIAGTHWSFSAGLIAAVTTLLYSYFGVILMSLLKEGLILILSIALNVEKIAQSKKASETTISAEPLDSPS